MKKLTSLWEEEQTRFKKAIETRDQKQCELNQQNKNFLARKDLIDNVLKLFERGLGLDMEFKVNDEGRNIAIIKFRKESIAQELRNKQKTPGDDHSLGRQDIQVAFYIESGNTFKRNNPKDVSRFFINVYLNVFSKRSGNR